MPPWPAVRRGFEGRADPIDGRGPSAGVDADAGTSPSHSLLAVLAGGILPLAPARADRCTCAPEIERFCTDVSRGRGRVSACLASEMNRLGAACRAEVPGVMASPLTPGYVRRALDPSFKAPLPAACVAPAKALCPAIPASDARGFACLYARSDRAGRDCSNAATATLKRQ